MNIFVLNTDPRLAAKDHCDKHVCKMILEAGQMLCTAHWIGWLNIFGKSLLDFETHKEAKLWLSENIPEKHRPPWLMTHVNHPCSIWTRESLSNYRWHADLGINLCAEYSRRYHKIHKGFRVHMWLHQNMPPSVEDIGLTNFKVCMDESYKISTDPVQCYREYYRRDKVRFAKWKNGPAPEWFKISNTY